MASFSFIKLQFHQKTFFFKDRVNDSGINLFHLQTNGREIKIKAGISFKQNRFNLSVPELCFAIKLKNIEFSAVDIDMQ